MFWELINWDGDVFEKVESDSHKSLREKVIKEIERGDYDNFVDIIQNGFIYELEIGDFINFLKNTSFNLIDILRSVIEERVEPERKVSISKSLRYRSKFLDFFNWFRGIMPNFENQISETKYKKLLTILKK